MVVAPITTLAAELLPAGGEHGSNRPLPIGRSNGSVTSTPVWGSVYVNVPDKRVTTKLPVLPSILATTASFWKMVTTVICSPPQFNWNLWTFLLFMGSAETLPTAKSA